MGKTVTSWKVDELIYKKFRIKCIERDIGLSEAIGEAMQEWYSKK